MFFFLPLVDKPSLLFVSVFVFFFFVFALKLTRFTSETLRWVLDALFHCPQSYSYHNVVFCWFSFFFLPSQALLPPPQAWGGENTRVGPYCGILSYPKTRTRTRTIDPTPALIIIYQNRDQWGTWGRCNGPSVTCNVQIPRRWCVLKLELCIGHRVKFQI